MSDAIRRVRVVPQGPLQDIDAAVVLEVRAVNEELGQTRLAVPDVLTAMAEQRQRFFLDDGQPNAWVDGFVEQRRYHEGR